MVARATRAAWEFHLGQGSDPGHLARERCLGLLQRSDAIAQQTSGVFERLLAPLSGSAADGLPSLTRNLRRLGVQVRSRLGRDAWRYLRRLQNLFAKDLPEGRAVERCDRVVDACAALAATVGENMVRSHAWTFLDCGRRVERLGNTLTLLSQTIAVDETRPSMEAALAMADSLLTYRARYLGKLQPAPVIDLLLTDESNPRSAAFQARAITEHLSALPRPPEMAGPGPAQRRAIALSTTLTVTDVVDLWEGDRLPELLDDLSEASLKLGDDIALAWFTHASPHRAAPKNGPRGEAAR
jgi:uncharacterized alpha-E superfamily protein